MSEIVDLQNVRNNKHWVRNANVVFPILDAVEHASASEKRVELFRAACQFRELIGSGAIARRGAWVLLRGAAGTMPIGEVDRTIRAGLYQSKRRP